MLLRRISVVVILTAFLCLWFVAIAGAQDSYRSRQSGAWEEESSWEVEYPSGSDKWHELDKVPDNVSRTVPDADDTVEIVDGDVVRVKNHAYSRLKLGALTITEGWITGDGPGWTVWIEATGNVIIKPNAGVTTQDAKNMNTGKIVITSKNGEVHIDGKVHTGDASGQCPFDDGANSGDIIIRGKKVTKAPGCKISTGNGGKGADATGAGEISGDGGDSGNIAINGPGEGVANKDKGSVVTGEPGSAGEAKDGARSGKEGTRGNSSEGGNVISMVVHVDPLLIEGRWVRLTAVNSIVCNGLTYGSIRGTEGIYFYVPYGVLDLRGCAPNSFIAGERIYVWAGLTITDPGVSIDDLMDPNPTFSSPVEDRISTTQGLTFAWYRNGEIMDGEWLYRLTLGGLWETRWETHTGKLDFREDHPEWNDQAVLFAFYPPPVAEGWRQTVFFLPREEPDTTFPVEPVMYRRPAGGGSPTAGFDLNAGVSDVYAFNLSGANNVSWRIPDLARVSEGDDHDTVYAIVDLSLYCAANPDGFAEGKWQVGDHLAAHDVEIVDGRVAGLEGVMWATKELDYGQLAHGEYKSIANSADLLNSGDNPGELVIVAEHSGGITDLTVECDCGVWGDINGDGAVDPMDVMCLVYHVYKGRDLRIQPANCPYECGDANCDGQTDPMDMISLINHVYKAMTLPCQDPCN